MLVHSSVHDPQNLVVHRARPILQLHCPRHFKLLTSVVSMPLSLTALLVVTLQTPVLRTTCSISVNLATIPLHSRFNS